MLSKYKQFNSRLDENQFLFLAFLSILFGFIVLSNIIDSDYFNDDIYNYQLKGTLINLDKDFLTWANEVNKGWLESSGRIFPISTYLTYFYLAFDEVKEYKTFILFLILSNIFLFSYLVYQISESKVLFLFLLITTPLFFQYRYYHDPILSFHGMLQFQFLFITLSLISYVKFLKRSNIFLLISSIIFFIASALTYEIGFLFSLFFVPITLNYISPPVNYFTVLKKVSPFFFISTILILATIYLREKIGITEGPYRLAIDYFLILKTNFYQSFSVLPLSYFSRSPSGKFNIENIDFYVISISAIILIFVLIRIFSLNITDKSKNRKLFFFGLLLILIPGVLISLSPKFQGNYGAMNKVRFGLAYLPIYIETFGFSLLFALLSKKFINSSLRKRIIFTVFLILVLVSHHVSNNHVISQVNGQYKDSREILSIFFADYKNYFKDNDIILINGESPIHSSNLATMYSGRKIKVINHPSKEEFNYEIEYSSDNQNAFVLLKNPKSSSDFFFFSKKNGHWKNQSMSKDKYSNSEIIITKFEGFYPWEGQEGEFRWAKRNPKLIFYKDTLKDQKINIKFIVNSPVKRDLKLLLNGRQIFDTEISQNKGQQINLDILLQTEANSLDFITNGEPYNPPGPDERALFFTLEKFSWIKNDQ